MSKIKCTKGMLIEIKKITILELLELIKDGKTPKEIEVKYGKLYERYKYDEDMHWYVTLDDTTILTISNKDDLDRCVELIPEVESFKEIKCIPIQENRLVKYKKDKFIESILNHFYDMDLDVRNKINELTKAVNYLLEKSDKDE